MFGGGGIVITEALLGIEEEPIQWILASRRILDGRRRMVIPDDGLTLHHHGYTRNLAHAVLLGVSRPAVEALDDHRFQPVWLGTEPFYDLAAWHPRGKAGMKVRLACNHARRLAERHFEQYEIEPCETGEDD